MTLNWKVMPTITWVKDYREDGLLHIRRVNLCLKRTAMYSLVMLLSMELLPGKRILMVVQVNVLPYVTAVLLLLSKVGDHGCEYMTGEVLVLGFIGRNFAGMSGGYAYVLDLDERRVNTGLVEVQEVTNDDVQKIKNLIERHVLYTNSAKGRHILDNWANFTHFLKSYACSVCHHASSH